MFTGNLSFGPKHDIKHPCDGTTLLGQDEVFVVCVWT